MRQAARPPISANLTVRDIANRLGVSEKTVRRIVDRGELRVHRIGRNLRFTEEDFQLYLAGRRR